MVWLLALSFSLTWIIGVISGHTVEGFLHILPVLAVALVIWLVIARRPSTATGPPQSRGRRKVPIRTGVRWRR